MQNQTYLTLYHAKFFYNYVSIKQRLLVNSTQNH